MATTNTTKNPPKSTPILLSTACDRRSCIAAALRIPCCFGHPPRSATPPGGAAARARHASGRFSRCAPSAATQERVADPESPAQGPGSSSSAPPGSSQHHRAHAVAAGKSCGLPEGHGPPSGCPPAELPPRAPLSPPSRVSLRPVLLAAAAGCWCCWRPPRPAGGNLWPSRTIFAVSHPPMAPGWGCGHSLGQSGRS